MSRRTRRSLLIDATRAPELGWTAAGVDAARGAE